MIALFISRDLLKEKNGTMQYEEDLISMISNNPEEALKEVYRRYYVYLCHAVYRVLPDKVLAEDIVQEVFFEFWKKRNSIRITSSLKGYLRRSAINRTLNYIRDNKMKFDDEEVPDQEDKSASISKEMEAVELQNRIDKAIKTLPEKCRIIFGMSRFEDMSYKEIAERLDISVKTVENQISKALKHMRMSLAQYLIK